MANHSDHGHGGSGRPRIPDGHVVPVQAGHQRRYSFEGEPNQDIVTFSQYWSGDDFSAPEADCTRVGERYVLTAELPLWRAARVADPTPEQQGILDTFVRARLPGWRARNAHRPEVVADACGDPIWCESRTADNDWRSDARRRERGEEV